MALRRLDMVPDSEAVSPARMSNSVVLPEPFGPMSAMRSPAATLNVSPLNSVLSE